MTIRQIIEIALTDMVITTLKEKDHIQERLRILEETMQKINKLVNGRNL